MLPLLHLPTTLQWTGSEWTHVSHCWTGQIAHQGPSCVPGSSSSALLVLPDGSQNPHYRAAGNVGPEVQKAPCSHQATLSAVLNRRGTLGNYTMHETVGFTKKYMLKCKTQKCITYPCQKEWWLRGVHQSPRIQQQKRLWLQPHDAPTHEALGGNWPAWFCCTAPTHTHTRKYINVHLSHTHTSPNYIVCIAFTNHVQESKQCE